MHSLLAGSLVELVRPDGGLDLGDMGLVEQEHADAALPDTATYGLGKLSAQEPFMPVQVLPLLLVFQRELAQQCFRVDTDAHAGKLKRVVPHRVPDNQVSIQADVAVSARCGPVIIVRRAAAMGNAVSQWSPDANQEDRAVFLGELLLPGFRTQFGIPLLGILRVDEGDVFRKCGPAWRVVLAHEEFRPFEGLIDLGNGILQIRDGAVLGAHDLLPVPLVDVDGMDCVDIIVRPDGVHVGVDARANGEVEVSKFHTLPFRKALDNLHLLVAHVSDLETDRSFHAIQVVVDTGIAGNKQRARHTGESQLAGKFAFKRVLHKLDGTFRRLGIESGCIPLRKIRFHR